MELGRECLEIWGYKRVDELIWVKTNQLQQLIRTGRTGHWLNHSKEHCLVSVIAITGLGPVGGRDGGWERSGKSHPHKGRWERSGKSQPHEGGWERSGKSHPHVQPLDCPSLCCRLVTRDRRQH
jgi:hypothetical protein